MSETKYEPVRAKGYYSFEDEQGETFYIVPSDVAGFTVKKETQLDRIEQKMDRVLNQLVSKKELYLRPRIDGRVRLKEQE
ncbi:hypothetical protein H9655_08810 [Cytobacillus sp. Sa5YUA1]|uniref:Uncharacterized protein n=1 Tax=Cytobacillus stercorigallinarum TaxID=2762240 RepID=A0ABR8QNP2_9BACI|nr:hypothetical protein [Cytobacillus stercorigallinarum]MBD7937130.1 hypothetical protein [Cytobacillus stercorigallinarum]